MIKIIGQSNEVGLEQFAPSPVRASDDCPFSIQGGHMNQSPALAAKIKLANDIAMKQKSVDESVDDFVAEMLDGCIGNEAIIDRLEELSVSFAMISHDISNNSDEDLLEKYTDQNN